LNLLIPMQIDVFCSSKTVRQRDKIIPFHPRSFLQCPLALEAGESEIQCFHINHPNNPIYETNFMHCFSADAKIKESKYEIVPPEQVTEQQIHLSATQKSQLTILLSKFENLFNGNLV